ncbi:MAG: hypothetical protein GF384_04770 [Elusimicrobia bacterium]|nr:hypothetical protein [Elusimicrobiota bacterium]MBD3412137.1 hypothetical protein [Elusimicrobiota bacterium]
MNEEQKERRRYPRAPIRVEIYCEEVQDELRRGSGILCFYSTDISLGGIFLETEVPFKIGDTIHLKFALPEHDNDMRLTGKVVRIREKNATLVPGIGVEFEHLSQEDKRTIEYFVINRIADQL